MAELLAVAAQELERAARDRSPRWARSPSGCSALRYEADDLGGELRGYLDGLGRAGTPAAQRGSRRWRSAWRCWPGCERKHGGDIAAVLAHAERCRARRDELEHADEALEARRARAGRRPLRARRAGRAARRARRKAAPELAAAVRERLAELAMADARFEIELVAAAGRLRAPRGGGDRDADRRQPGGPPAPLREVASGGELSRVMLALLSVAHGEPAADADDERRCWCSTRSTPASAATPPGRSASTCAALPQGRQILCITHLPQVAALAQRHFTIVKDTSVDPATTTVTTLDGDAVVGELVRMLGAGSEDSAASEHARELLRAA